MSAFDFLHWCFSSIGHGIGTVIVLVIVGEVAEGVIRAIRRPNP